MYAIIQTGGKQYRVSAGDIINIDKIDNKKSVTFKDVLMVSDGDTATYGNPFVSSAKVSADVMGTDKAKKVLVYKQKMRKNHRKLRGHRQLYTAIKIKDIKVS